MKKTLAENFWGRVEKANGDGCWLWTGTTRSRNPRRAYGMVWVKEKGEKGKSRPASHVYF